MSVLGSQLGRSREALRAFVNLLLPEQQEPDVCPPRGFSGRELGHAFQLATRQHVLARLQRGQPRIKRRHGLPIGIILDRRFAAARDQDQQRERRQALTDK
jgi:hypothetical protein